MVAGHLVKVKSRGAIRIGNQRPRFRFSQIIVDAHQPFDAEACRARAQTRNPGSMGVKEDIPFTASLFEPSLSPQSARVQ